MFEEITGALAYAVGMVFEPLSVFSPAVSLFIVSSLITVFVIALNGLTMNKKIVKEIKVKLQDIREQLTAAQKIGDNESVNKFLKEMMIVNNDYMKQMYKGLIVSLFAVALFLPYLGQKYSGMVVASLPFNMPMVGTEMNWIVWYVLVSFTIGWVVRKILGFD